MDKELFQEALRYYLAVLPKYEIEKSITYFNEMIEDRVDEGMTEQEAIASLGDPKTIAHTILAEEQSLVEQMRAQFAAKPRLTGWQKALMILGFPIWLPLLLVGFALCLATVLIVFAIFISGFAFVVSGFLTLILSPFKLTESFGMVLLNAGGGSILLGIGLLILAAAKSILSYLKPYYRKLRLKRKE